MRNSRAKSSLIPEQPVEDLIVLVRGQKLVLDSDLARVCGVSTKRLNEAVKRNLLNSPRAVQMSVFVVRAFVKMREVLAQNKALAAKLAELERKLTARLDDHEKAIVHILDEIKKLMAPPPEPRRRPIRFLRD
jgi:hypothetical protein